jgi:hypothetical protein
MICKLCERCIPEGLASEHHLKPVCCGGKKGPRVTLHTICHKQIHALFTESTLSMVYNTISALKNQSDVRRFLKWIRDKPPEFDVKIRVSRRKR